MYGIQNKWCFVPCCKNTSLSTPCKKFLTVPQDASRKVKWFEAARREVPTTKSIYFCCEDHFNFEEDMENYIRYKLMGGRITLKQHVVPHIFKCQRDNQEQVEPSRRERKRLITEALLRKSQSLKEPCPRCNRWVSLQNEIRAKRKYNW